VECAIRVTIQRDRKIDRLGVRGVLHSLDALLDRLKSLISGVKQHLTSCFYSLNFFVL
jgi:hypothetical protein